MSGISSLTELVCTTCKEHSLHVESALDGNFRLSTDQATGITIFFKIEDFNNFSYYFLVRTNGYVFSGDRSDIHVILSIVFASFLRNFETNISSSLFDIGHPLIDDEIWGRKIIPEQNPKQQDIKSWKDLEAFVVEIIKTVAFWRNVFWQYAGCPCVDCLTKDGYEDNIRDYEMSAELDHSKNKLLKSTRRVNYGIRNVPNWNYFYDIYNEITIIKSEGIAKFLEIILNSRIYNDARICGINGEFFISGGLKNFISDSIKSEFRKYFKGLGKSIPVNKIEFVPLENMIVSVSIPYIIALGRLTGEYKYKAEREKVKKRHNKESELLFPIDLFEWNESICPDQFENLIKWLLERESRVASVRKNSPINQGDKGRDLLIEWNIIDEKSFPETESAFLTIKVVGQCKASKNSVGKNKVLDIRDTIDTHNADGFFLAVSSQISTPLTEKLEDLKSKGIWTEWWNKDDIEMRLSKNQDLIPLFPKVLTAKKGVKFYEKDI
ncbi:restriction endonuclease [Geofilum rubicundum]|uniref:Restriction endonuclease type IV Mrr domain-containing protein n=1 Tax=Geofilum rubicundum JCM 15548 TaxID=1236989 RepID=A0A0E9LWI5_9BACT|nr:restriction endonuclease [Geofilum rubicundum]GAO29927.1 hypothetical protein JCM15548_12162 [Geofilum rubicundum JCM 15548]